MGPPFARPYNYFRQDAEAYMQVHRPGWSQADIKNTTSALWAGSGLIRTHYAGAEGQHAGPGLPTAVNTVPAQPYTATEAEASRKSRQLPAPAPAPAPVPSGNGGNVDSIPYNFWPQLPWAPEPELASLDRATRDDKAKKTAWLATSPHMNTEADEVRWHGVKLLGAGGYGVAGLWLELDDEKNITDKMVIKDAKLDPAQSRDPKNWRNRLPREIQNHRLVEERRFIEPEACRYLIRSRGDRLFISQRRYRIYLDHYEADLYHSLRKHIDNPSTHTLPEKVIWHMVKALASACLVLQQGTITGEAPEAWKPITHLDLQLGNIFLELRKPNLKRKLKESDDDGEHEAGARDNKRAKAASSEEEWTEEDWQDFTMIPVVADFGLAFYSLDNDDCLISDNPEDYLWQSHETRYAPEHQWQFGPPWAPLGEKTDVWGIGSILWHLLTHRTLDEGPVREDRHDQKAYIPISSHKYPENKEPLNDYTTLSGRLFPESSGYSAKLKDLVRACLNWSQEDRPTLQHILDEANHHLHERGTKKTLKEWGDFELALPMKFDGYQIGVRYSSTPDTTSSIV